LVLLDPDVPKTLDMLLLAVVVAFMPRGLKAFSAEARSVTSGRRGFFERAFW
jgi:hypothetical protein